MSDGGFFERKTASPTGLALVVLGHAALLGAAILIKGPQFIIPPPVDTQVEFVPLPQAPEPERPVQTRPDPAPTRVTLAPPDRIVPTPPRSPFETGVRPADPGPLPPIADPLPPRQPDPAPPVRVEAQIDPRFASALQPQYPASEQRAQNSGTVRIRVTIGTDGRVRAVARVSATSDAFWAAAERQALTRWRFRPATLDGRPVESTKVMTIHFRIEEV